MNGECKMQHEAPNPRPPRHFRRFILQAEFSI